MANRRNANKRGAAASVDTNDIIFCEGLRIFEPHKNAPDFVIGSVVITLSEFKKWVNSNADKLGEYKGEKQLNLQLLESKSGDLYFAVNTYGTPYDEKKPAKKQADKKQKEEATDDLPF